MAAGRALCGRGRWRGGLGPAGEIPGPARPGFLSAGERERGGSDQS